MQPRKSQLFTGFLGSRGSEAHGLRQLGSLRRASEISASLSFQVDDADGEAGAAFRRGAEREGRGSARSSASHFRKGRAPHGASAWRPATGRGR